MKKNLSIFIIVITLTSCNPNGSTENIKTQSDSLSLFPDQKDRRIFKNINDVIQNQNVCIWTDPKKDMFESSALSFDPSLSNKVTLVYLGNCSFKFPFKFDQNKITIYWDTLIENDCKPDLIKTLKNIDKNYFGKPFMTLELADDTTLKAIYLFPELIEKLNLTDKSHTLFPNQFISTYILM